MRYPFFISQSFLLHTTLYILSFQYTIYKCYQDSKYEIKKHVNVRSVLISSEKFFSLIKNYNNLSSANLTARALRYLQNVKITKEIIFDYNYFNTLIYNPRVMYILWALIRIT